MKETPKNILVVAITRMGDLLQASPTLAGLKAQYPGSKTTVVVEKNFSSICEGIPGIDVIYPLDLSTIVQCLSRENEGIIDAFRFFDETVVELRSRKFDMCINMASSGYTAILLRLLEIPDNRGWISDDEGFRLISNPWAMLFAAFVYHSNREYNSINLVDILRCSAGVHEHPRRLVYNIPQSGRESWKALKEALGVKPSGPIIAFQAGASQEKRQWSPARCAQVTKLLIEKLNATVVFTGSATETPIIEAIFSQYQHPQMISAVGKTDLPTLSALLEDSELLVTGDTGTMHLSVAVGTPVIALFLASAYCFETGPYSEGNIVIQPQIACHPCNPNLPCSKTDCHDQVSPEAVCQLVEIRLQKTNEELRRMQLPRSIIPPEIAAVYVTEFDDQGFLDFRKINGSASRRGFHPEFFDRARIAYRKVWKGEFGSELGIARCAIHRPEIDPQQEGISLLIHHTIKGRELIKELEQLIADVTSPPRLLGEVNKLIERNDREIEDIGLRHSVLGALVRMFVMERENLRGDDPLVLARATKALYDTLEYRTRVFAEEFQEDSNVPSGGMNILNVISQ